MGEILEMDCLTIVDLFEFAPSSPDLQFGFTIGQTILYETSRVEVRNPNNHTSSFTFHTNAQCQWNLSESVFVWV